MHNIHIATDVKLLDKDCRVAEVHDVGCPVHNPSKCTPFSPATTNKSCLFPLSFNKKLIKLSYRLVLQVELVLVKPP